MNGIKQASIVRSARAWSKRLASWLVERCGIAIDAHVPEDPGDETEDPGMMVLTLEPYVAECDGLDAEPIQKPDVE
jgi:hypothetical protein